MATVAIFGDFRGGRLGASYRRAFEALGHQVVQLDTTRLYRTLPWWLTTRLPRRALARRHFARRVGSRELNEQVLDTLSSEKPDLLLISNGDYLMPATLRAARQFGTKTVIFHADNPLPSQGANTPESVDLARECDLYLVWSRPIAAGLAGLGAKCARFFPFGWDPDVFPARVPREHARHEVVFIGNWEPDRERFLEPVARRFRLAIWGSEYWAERTRRGSPLRSAWQRKYVEGVEASEIIADSKIILNPLRGQHHVRGEATGVIMRNFEVPGCGGFLLSTRTPEAAQLFPEDELAAYYSTTEECLRQIDRFLTEEPLRRQIAAAAHADIERRHRYEHRAAEMLELTFSLSR